MKTRIGVDVMSRTYASPRTPARTITTIISNVLRMIAGTGVGGRGLTRASTAEPGSTLSRESAKNVLPTAAIDTTIRAKTEYTIATRNRRDTTGPSQ